LLELRNRSFIVTRPESALTSLTQRMKPRTFAHGCGEHDAEGCEDVGGWNGCCIEMKAAAATATTTTPPAPMAA
jgi:hypothetical protein